MSGRRVPSALWCIAVAGTTLVNAHAQEMTTRTDAAPPYRLFRFDEDYRYLQDPRKRTDVWDPIKYISLGVDPNWYLSFGGELRKRFEYYSEPNFGLQGQGHNAYLLHRTLLHADVHGGDFFRAFVQFGSHLAPWKDAAEPPYLDRLDLQQAFLDVRLPLVTNLDVDPIVRIGRQEMAYGSQRLVAIRDAPNVRRNFDGVRISDTVAGARIDAFVTRPVLQQSGIFDDPPNEQQAFWGVYATLPVNFVTGGGLDLYYLGFENENAIYAVGPGKEHRQTIGSRFFGSNAGWDWDWEALGQFGTFDQLFGSFSQQDIRAWGVSTDTGYTFDVAGWKLRIGLKADLGSGDHNRGGGTLGTLNPLFPKLAYFNQAALFGPSNTMDLQPSLTVQPTENLKLIVGYDILWRQTTNDAIYTGAGLPIAGTAGRPGRLSGRQLSVDLAWQVNRHVQVDTGYVHVTAAEALLAAGGNNVDFVYLSAAYKF